MAVTLNAIHSLLSCSKAWSWLLVAALLVAVTRPSVAVAQGEARFARFYWHASAGGGVYSLRTNYTDGTVKVVSASLDAVTTLGVRVTRLLALGGMLRSTLLPAPSVTEDRCCGARDTSPAFASAGGLAPALVLLPSPFRISVSFGLMWSIAASRSGDKPGPKVPFGGVGFGGSVGLGYDIPLSSRLALVAEIRGTSGMHFDGSGDETNQGGWDVATTLLLGLSRR